MNMAGSWTTWSQRARKLGAFARGKFRGFPVHTLRGQEILLPPVAHSHFWVGPSEDEQVFEFLALALPGDGVFIDVGGNIGLYVATLARAKQGRIRAVSFEPNGTSAAILKQTLALNGIQNIVRLEQLALSSTSGTIRMSNFDGGRITGL